MDIMNKVNELAQAVGDKANELVEYGKLNAQILSENNEIDPTGALDIGHEFTPFKFEEYIALDKKYRAYEAELRKG